MVISNIRQSLLQDNKENDVFDSALLYCPYNITKSTIDINNLIASSVNNGGFTDDGYYVNGNNQELTYTNNILLNALSNNVTIFIEFTPYNLGRNLYIVHIGSTYPKTNHLGIFIYYTKNNLLGTTTYAKDDVVANSPVIRYENKYKICIKLYNSTLQYFINGIFTGTEIFHPWNISFFSIGRHKNRTDRGAKAVFHKIAVWDKLLTDDDCINLTK